MRAAALLVGLVIVGACTSAVHESSASPAHPAARPAQAPNRAAATAVLQDWPAYHANRARTGVYSGMPAPTGTPRIVGFKRLDAAVYASPLIVGGMVVVATENNSLYGFTAAGTYRWHRKLGAPARRSDLPCGNIDPSGITGTPVYYAGTRLAYVVVEHANPVRHAMAAIDIRTGAVRWTRQLTLPGVSQDAMQQRGALSVVDGRIWVTFGGRAGDCGNYKGRLIGIPLSGRGTAVAFTVPTAREAGMWTPPGPSIDANHRIYVSVGNGAALPGDRYDLSDSVLKFDSNAHLLSYFAPSNWAAENAADVDLGSQGPALVGSRVFIAGKSGTGYVLNRSGLGGIGGQVSSRTVCRSFGGTAVYSNVVFVPCDDGVRAVRINSNGSMSILWHTSTSITGSPVIGGGRVWTLNPGSGVLHGLNTLTGVSTEHISVGVTSRFATPAIYGANIYVGTMTGLAIVRP